MDKAFEKARAAYGTGAYDDATLEFLFPALKESESEDERIRREIIDFIQWAVERGTTRNDYHQAKRPAVWIAYLEKQKEQQPVITHGELYHTDTIGTQQVIAGKMPKKPAMIQWTGNNLKEVVDFTGKSPRFNEWFKTWEEFEAYVHSHGNIFKLFNDDGSHYEVPVGAWIVKTPDGCNVASKAVFKQKPAEWSEEDKKDVAHIIRILDDCYAYGRHDLSKTDHENLVNKLKSLRPQSKIHYWTEEEIEPIIGDYLTGKEHYGGMLARLRCLKPKPQWCPSEEQMKALNALNLYGDLSYVGQQKQLISLYQDLKKLM